jgi:putative nucleotidyltransferase with HDIG domain
MKFVALCHIKPGMVLARPICNENDITLLGKNVVLTQHFCDKIQDLCCVNGIYVYDEYDLIDKQEFKDVTEEKARKEYVKSGKLFHLDAISYFSTSIVNKVRNSSKVSYLLLDLFNHSKKVFEHSIRVANVAVAIGVGLGFSNEELSNLAMAALLHDIGKIKVDKSIINKKGPLTPEEKNIKRNHPILGYEVVKSNPKIDSTVKCGILMHHENIDGSGYPKGIQGDEIYKFAKIIRIADVYDAIINEDTLKKPYAVNEALEYMMSKVGVLFDEEIFKVFLNYIEIFKVGDIVMLSTNNKALVVENHNNYALRPTIELNNKRIDLHTSKKALNIVIKNKC